MANDFDVDMPTLSVTVTVKAKAPTAPGVPLSTPALDMAKPAGREPADQLYGGLPPLAANG